MKGAERNWAALTGPAIGLGGVVGYFAVVFLAAAWLPEVRNTALPNWLLVAAGLGLSALGVRRARTRPAMSPGRLGAGLLAAVNVLLAGTFSWFLYGLPSVPVATGPAPGTPAPDFAATTNDGRTVHLADFRGSPLLLVFYRGHW